MAKRAIVPSALRAASEQLNMSPAILSGGHVFLTGAAGGDLQGHMPDDPAAQMRNAFDKMKLILEEAGLSLQSIVEMTTDHVGLRDHFETFDAVRLDCLDAPYPAWTAVEAAGLRREGAVIEIHMAIAPA